MRLTSNSQEYQAKKVLHMHLSTLDWVDRLAFCLMYPPQLHSSSFTWYLRSFTILLVSLSLPFDDVICPLNLLWAFFHGATSTYFFSSWMRFIGFLHCLLIEQLLLLWTFCDPSFQSSFCQYLLLILPTWILASSMGVDKVD